VLCDCLDAAGNLLNETGARKLASSYDLPMISISDVIRFRLASETIVEQIAAAKLPTEFAGEFEAICFLSKNDQAEHLALRRGNLAETDADGRQLPVLVRVQAEDRMGDLLGLNTGLGLPRIRGALEAISARGRGLFVYVRHPRKGILAEQARALAEGRSQSSAVGENWGSVRRSSVHWEFSGSSCSPTRLLISPVSKHLI
jgi:3,4-dihydroxy 2-butanone 4-phosphate synthase/GTP cyclohydrolase II